MPKPNTADYPEYFGKYINLVQETNLPEAFKKQLPEINNFLGSITEERSKFAYAPGKWTIKELLQHTIDTERIFTYRALCISRKETASLPSFEENLYAENSNGNERSWESLKNEFTNLRKTTEDLFKSFTNEMLEQKGLASNKLISVNSIGFITIGHVYHHIKVVKEKYLNA